jgi:hypothetical protein
MKMTSRIACLMLASSALSVSQAASAASSALPFNLSPGFGETQTMTISVDNPGCILVSVASWSAQPNTKKAGKIALILNGPGQEQAYERVDGAASNSAPLWMSHAAQSAGQWKVTIANFDKKGSAVGNARVIYPPTQMPCEFRAVVRRDGTVGLSWVADGGVTVERFTGSQWRPVSDCGQSSCVDASVARGSGYAYRACSDTPACSDESTTTPPIKVTVR